MTPGHVDVAVRYFASLRETLGPAETIELASGSTVGDLRRALAARSAAHAAALAPGRAVRSALDQVLCDETAVVRPGAEVGFFPPVTGG